MLFNGRENINFIIIVIIVENAARNLCGTTTTTATPNIRVYTILKSTGGTTSIADSSGTAATFKLAARKLYAPASQYAPVRLY